MKSKATMRSASRKPGHGLEHAWYAGAPWLLLLLPIAYLFQVAVALRRWAYRAGLIPSYPVAVPVIVVGNITVGGSGKTPLVTWLAKFVQQRGYRPGIIARGYGGNARTWPQQVREDSDPAVVGDEAVMLARQCGCPIAVGPDRVAAAAGLTAGSMPITGTASSARRSVAAAAVAVFVPAGGFEAGSRGSEWVRNHTCCAASDCGPATPDTCLEGCQYSLHS